MTTPEQRCAFEADGFFLLKGFAPAATLSRMEKRIVELARTYAAGGAIGEAIVVPEPALAQAAGPAEAKLSKMFRVHRLEPVFHDFAIDERTLELVRGLIGDDVDCFLSQFVFKLPGALGQPWHQDAFYFPFDRGPQIGLWLAITEAAIDNGPLWVLPGSHREAVHRVVKDRRPHAVHAYVEIVDHDFARATPVLLDPGDLLVFHSHLMHRSTDNGSTRRRAAMVYHYADAATQDRSLERFGRVPGNVDWMPAMRRGVPVRDPGLSLLARERAVAARAAQ